MMNYKLVKKNLKSKKISFEIITFTDKAVSARPKDTSIKNNYDPKNAIKTLIVRSKSGFTAIIIPGSDQISQTKLKNLIGKWSVVNKNELGKIFKFKPGTVCPLLLDLPFIIDKKVMDLEVWSMGAGDISKGLNIKSDICLKNIQNKKISDITFNSAQTPKKCYINAITMDKIDFLLTRGVDSIYPSKDALEKVLRSGKKLTLYQGFDPTGTKLHIGHMVGFRKLRQWQDLGHHVVFLIGDGTGLAGDPSGKMKARGRFMSRQELRDNARSYLMQASKIVNFDGENPIEIKYNGDWLTELKLEDLLNIAQNFSLQQMIERDMYQERMKKGDTINLREFLYPLLQGYDSVVMKVDLELGGTDQTFNMLAGRTLVKAMQNREKFVMTVPLLADSRGVKIGKTEGNVIGLTDAPGEFFAKIMSLSDDAIVPCFRMLTDMPDDGINNLELKIKQGENPMRFKKQLAFELTGALNSQTDAQKAQKQFEAVHQNQEYKDINSQQIELGKEDLNVKSFLKILVSKGFIPSMSEAKRLYFDEKAIKLYDSKTQKEKTIDSVQNNDIIKKGSKVFIRIKLIN